MSNPEEEQQGTKLLAWKTKEGPFYASDICDCPDCEDSDECILVVMCTFGDEEEPEDLDLKFPDFNTCYSFMVALDNSMKPIEVYV